MKRKLFISGCYLFVIGLLLIFLSYSAYRIKIESTVILPKTHTIAGSITFEASENILSPGYSTQSAIFSVNNDSCDLDLEYTISIETCGRLPLQFKLDNSIVKLNTGQTQGAFTTIYKLTGGAFYSNIHNLEISWNNSAPNYDSMDLKREVDKITVKTNIYALPDIDEEKLDIVVTKFY